MFWQYINPQSSTAQDHFTEVEDKLVDNEKRSSSLRQRRRIDYTPNTRHLNIIKKL